MKQMKSIAIFSVLFCLAGQIQAQLYKPKFGLRAGGNVTTIFGEKETGLTESYSSSTRISVAAVMNLPLHKRFGLITELGFTQRGANYSSVSENSFLKLPAYGNYQAVQYSGYKRVFDLSIINGYLELPVMGYAELIKDKLKLELGASIGFLVSSDARGTLKYGEARYIDAENPNISQFIEMELNYRFLSDDIGELGLDAARTVKIDGASRNYPVNLGAYYLTDYDDKDGKNVFKTVDFGLQAGLAYHLTEGLKIGSRVYYGLADITNTRHDFSQLTLNTDNSYKTLDQKDYNFGVYFYIGLQF